MIKILKKADLRDKSILRRCSEPDPAVTASVSEIIKNVRAHGDAAVREYSIKFDGSCPDTLELPREALAEAVNKVPSELLDVIREASRRIERYHRAQLRQSYEVETDGTILMMKVRPLDTVGAYVPGGTAPYPSTVLMNVVPAKIAGVKEIIMVSPPTCRGEISPVILATAYIAGVDRVFQVGGAQAIAALAYGTESIPKVDKIVGPGNAYVAEAKRQVFGPVGIDLVAGPSEILVISDGTSNPAVVAADMLSQAEHDKLSTAVLITTSEKLAKDTAAEIEKQLSVLPREAIARVSIENNGLILITDSIEDAIDLANEVAPEHLELCVDNPFDYVSLIKNAGSVFLGKYCPEALGDYFSGTNHTLPTGGTANYGSPLSVDDFIKKTSFTYYTAAALNTVKDSIALFARQEELEGHARSVLSRGNSD
ncbi:MAG: histidinol dehydrogenase [Eubacteriales bacterium]|nr:histidinol dehydrogenase [Eubacteriales bacterium]